MSKKTTSKSKRRHLGIVHSCDEFPYIPTHTHGLTDKGLPEFIMDPLAFGPKGNPSRIDFTLGHLNKPENIFKLEAIKNGQTIKIASKELDPEFDGSLDYVYCCRRVHPDFEGVKQAYFPEEIKPEMWFIQIYVDGDDYALTDQYYKGGVKW